MNSLSLFPRDAIQALLMSVKTISKILLKLNGEKKKRKRQDLCNCCDDKFTTLTILKAHNEAVHEGVKRSCDHCYYQFNPKKRFGHYRESVIKYLKKTLI